MTDYLRDDEFVIERLVGCLMCAKSAPGAIITPGTINGISDEGMST